MAFPGWSQYVGCAAGLPMSVLIWKCGLSPRGLWEDIYLLCYSSSSLWLGEAVSKSPGLLEVCYLSSGSRLCPVNTGIFRPCYVGNSAYIFLFMWGWEGICESRGTAWRSLFFPPRGCPGEKLGRRAWWQVFLLLSHLPSSFGF